MRKRKRERSLRKIVLNEWFSTLQFACTAHESVVVVAVAVVVDVVATAVDVDVNNKTTS